MIQSRNWTAIERLPEAPGVAIMTSGGYWLDGRFYPDRQPSHAPMEYRQPEQPRRSFFDRVLGR